MMAIVNNIPSIYFLLLVTLSSVSVLAFESLLLTSNHNLFGLLISWSLVSLLTSTPMNSEVENLSQSQHNGDDEHSVDVVATSSMSEPVTLGSNNSQNTQFGSWFSDERTPPMSACPHQTSFNPVNPLQGITDPRDTIVINEGGDLEWLLTRCDRGEEAHLNGKKRSEKKKVIEKKKVTEDKKGSLKPSDIALKSAEHDEVWILLTRTGLFKLRRRPFFTGLSTSVITTI